jgi:hypothetical protein
VGLEAGSYHAVPINPAIGTAFVAFMTPGTSDAKVFAISRIQRTGPTRIHKLALREILDDNGFGPEFVLTRTGL